VLVLERFEVGHRRGSSHGTSRIFRLSYAEEEYVRLARDSLEAWRVLERESGEELLVTTGSLDCGSHAAAHREAMEACGVACEELDEADARRRFGVRLPGGGLLQADGGNLRADRCAAAFLAGATAAGAELHEQTHVTSIERARGGVHLETQAGPVDAQAAVVTAGAWAPRLLATAGIELDVVPTRETVVYLRLGRSEPPPSIIHEVSPGRLPYALAAPGIGLKAGVHQTGPVVDPDVEGGPEPALADEAAAWAAARFPDADPEPLAVETCLYTNAPGDRFLLERHGPIVVGSACSGHGFKFAPVTGERLAALALEAAG
jgi:sarcosine oxidase